MAGPVMCASSQQWVPDFSPNTMLLDSCDALNFSDLLCLRHDQQLEHATEYNSIIPEPLGSRLKSRSATLPYHNLAWMTALCMICFASIMAQG